MPRLPISEQALRLALTRPTATRQPQSICRACIRQYHPSPLLRAELPFWKRITNSLFGSSEQKAATEKRDEAHQQRLQELAEQGGGKTETLVDDKGRTWTIAAVVDPSVNKQYVQAQRWDGLEWVGSKEWIARKNDSGEAYVGFNPRRKLELKPHHWQRVLHHVTVEVLALAQAGRDVSAVYTERAVNLEDWQRTLNVLIKVQKKGAVELHLQKDDSLEQILKAIPESLAEEIIMAAENAEFLPEPIAEEIAEELAQESVEEAAQELAPELAQESAEEGLEAATEPIEEESIEAFKEQHLSPTDIDAAEKETMEAIRTAVQGTTKKHYAIGKGKKRQVFLYGGADTGFLQVPLADPAIKLAIVKRVQQLTGLRLRDHAISSATTVEGLFSAVKFKAEPKKLHDALKLNNVNGRNVTLHHTRQTPIHKHKQVGRWKVVEEELINRGLPVTGSRYQGAKTTSPML